MCVLATATPGASVASAMWVPAVCVPAICACVTTLDASVLESDIPSSIEKQWVGKKTRVLLSISTTLNAAGTALCFLTNRVIGTVSESVVARFGVEALHDLHIPLFLTRSGAKVRCEAGRGPDRGNSGGSLTRLQSTLQSVSSHSEPTLVPTVHAKGRCWKRRIKPASCKSVGQYA